MSLGTSGGRPESGRRVQQSAAGGRGERLPG